MATACRWRWAARSRRASAACSWRRRRRAADKPTASTPGPPSATGAKTSRYRHATCRAKPSATSSSTRTATGSRTPLTARSGCRAPWRRTGHPTERAAGAGFRPGAGPGSTTRRGVLRPFTTAAGRRSARAGPGCRDALRRGRCMRRRWSVLSAAQAVTGRCGRHSAGFRWRRAKPSGPPTARVRTMSAV